MFNGLNVSGTEVLMLPKFMLDDRVETGWFAFSKSNELTVEGENIPLQTRIHRVKNKFNF